MELNEMLKQISRDKERNEQLLKSLQQEKTERENEVRREREQR